MKKLLPVFLLLLWSPLHGQNLISINPDSALQGQTLTTTITGSGLYFTQGSGPTSYGNVYMTNFGQSWYPNWVNVLDDDHFEAEWTIPTNATPGNYIVRYDYLPDPWNPWGWPVSYDVPGGFNVLACQAPAVTITAQSATSFCTGGSVVLQASYIPATTYYWYRYGGYVGSGINYTATMSGVYNVRAYDVSGCYSVSNDITVSVNSLPYATIGYTGQPQFCPGGSKTLTANAVSGATYQWFLNNVPLTGATTQVYFATVGGNYTVQVTSSSGCSKLSTAVSVTALSSPPATITPSGSTTFCAGTGVTLNANAGTGYTYQWYKYGIAIPGATAPSLYVSNCSKYKVQVTDANGCTRKSANVTTTSIPLPLAFIYAQGPTTFCSGDSVTLSANTGTGITYQWKKYSNPIAGATSSDYVVKTPGKYKTVVTNSYGCSRTSNSITVSVPCRTPGIETTPGDIIITVDAALQRLYVDGLWSGPVEIIGMDGRNVLSVVGYRSDGIDLTSLPDGLYVAVIRSDSGTITQKFYHHSVR